MPVMTTLTLFGSCAGSKLALSTHLCSLFGPGSLCPSVGQQQSHRDQSGHSAWSRVMRVVMETSQSPRQFNSASSALFPGESKHMYLLHEQKSRFLTVLVFVLLVFKLARGTCLPSVGPRAGVSTMCFEQLTLLGGSPGG